MNKRADALDRNVDDYNCYLESNIGQIMLLDFGCKWDKDKANEVLVINLD